MSFLIVKNCNEQGCIALETKKDPATESLFRYLTQRTGGKGLQIAFLTDADTYEEYNPFTFVSSETEFIGKVFKMAEENMEKLAFIEVDYDRLILGDMVN